MRIDENILITMDNIQTTLGFPLTRIGSILGFQESPPQETVQVRGRALIGPGNSPPPPLQKHLCCDVRKPTSLLNNQRILTSFYLLDLRDIYSLMLAITLLLCFPFAQSSPAKLKSHVKPPELLKLCKTTQITLQSIISTSPHTGTS